MKKTKQSQPKKQNKKEKSKKLLDNPIVFWGIITIALVFILFAVFSKLTGNVITGNATNDFIKDFFSFKTKWGDNLDTRVAQSIFLLLVTGIIWGALKAANFPNSGALQGLISIAVGFLAVIYLTPTEVLTVLQSYTALGITLTFILPFVILVFISAQLIAVNTKETASVGKVLVEIFLWIFYIVVLGYKMITYIVDKGSLKAGTGTGLDFTILIMLAVFVISFLILIFNKKFRKFVNGLEIDLEKARMNALSAKAVGGAKMVNQLEEAQSPKSRRKARRAAQS